MAETYGWRKEKKETNQDEEQQNKEQTYGWRKDSPTDFVSMVGTEITDRVNTWLQNHNNYISNYKNRYSDRKYNYEDDYVKDSADWLDTINKQKSNFDAEADNILSYMDQYKSYLNPEWMDSVRNILTDARKDQGSIIEGVSKDNEWWNSFGSEELVKQYGSAEEAYKYYQRDDGYRKKYEGKSHNYLQTALQTMGDGDEKEWLSSYAPSVLYDERSKADLDAMAKEIEDMENLYNDAFTVGHWYNEYALGFAPYDSKRMNTYNRLKDEYGGDIYNLEEAISKKKREMTLASRVQEGIKLSGVGDETSEYYDPEFKQYTGYTGSTWIDGGFDRFFSWDDSAGMKTGYEDIRYDYINDPDAVTKVLSKSANDADLHLLSGLQPYQHMTEDQVATYNYYYAKHGKEAAGHYLDSIQDSLNATQGQQMAQRIEDKWLLQQLSGIGAGLDQAHSGLKNVFSNADYIPTSATQYASGYVRENLGENGGAFSQGLYDLITTTANMAPSILLSTAIGTLNPTVGAAVGNAMMGASAAGNAYSDAINRGFGKKEARTYSTLIGASEVALGSLLGGISKLGGVSSKLANAVAGIDNAFLRFSLQYGGKIASESLEEGLQEILDPLLQNAIMYADEDVNWNEVAYSALLGGLSAGLLEGVGTVAQVAQTEAALNKQAVKEYGGMTDAIIQEGIESDQKSKSYKLAQKYQKQVEGQNGKAGKAMTGAQIRNLLAANQDQVTPKDMKLIQQAAEKRLTELGQTDDVSKLAEIATRYATGGKVSKEEKSFLANSKYGSRVYNELLPKNIESGDYTSEWTEDIGTREVNVAQYGKKRLQAQIRAALDFMANPEDPNAYKSLEKRVGTESKLSVSESGKATIRESGKEVDLKQAEVVNFVQDKNTGKITDMTMMVDGEEVRASGIDYTDSSESYLFDAVQKIENITPGAATVAVRGYDPASGQTVSEYLNGFDEGFNYGYHNYSEADLKSGEFAPKLSQEQMMSAYRLGQSARNISDVAADAPVVKMRTEADAKLSAEQKLAKQKAQIESDDVEVYFEDGGTVIKFDEHTGKYDKKRNAAVNTAKFLSKLGIGGKYYFFESYLSKTLKDAEGNRLRVYKDANGNEVEAPNGIYKETDGSIHIDLNAGDYGQGTALFTLGHELTHFVKAQSKKQFAILSDLVKEAFDKTDTSMHERVLAKQKFLSDKRGEVVSYTEAHEEVVADAMSTMLTDGSFHEKLMEIKVKDKGLFNTIKRFFEKMIAKFRKEYDDLTPDQQDAQDIRQLKDMFDKIQNAFVEALVESSENFHASMESVVESNAEAVSANEIVTDGAVVTDGNGERFSIRSMKHDIAEGKMFEDLKTHCNWTDAQVKELRTQLKALVEYMIPYRDILDMNESYGAEGRRFSPYKPNSDPLYKISMDFSTLCSKRLLTQYVIENLQLRENRPMSAEEQMAIRAMLNEYRKVEKGLQVACAMCYVEAARLKSPNQIQKWMDDPSTAMRNYFADKNPEFAAYVKKAQGDFKESRGYDRDASKKQMKEANKKSGSKDVNELNKLRPKLREQYQPSAEEWAIIEKAKSLPNSTYLTAGNLATLSETDPAIYAAYTSFVRTATRSKSLETDEPYYYGDSTRDNGNGIIVSDSFIEAVNRENGMRFSSWSDWRIQHLLDYITAVIDNSVRGAAMHGYTKFGDEVRVLGKTGMMFNMSGVTGSQTGLNKDGSLNFSDTESIDVNEAIQLREEFPEHAGLQCIGVGNEHIIALLRSDIIDYVIPYHVSGLNAALRRMADIHGWKDYTGTQNASIDKSIKFENAVDQEHWHEEPSFSEFFVGYDTGMSGIDAMRASAERYKQLCKDRGLTPKFNQFANEDNYWKLLIDRKMINQQTGNLIRQKAVTPTFDFDVIKGVVDKFVDNYDAGLESRALNHIVENWDTIPQRIKDLKKGSKTKKSVDTLANQTVAAQPTKHSDRYWYPKMTKTEIAEVKDIAQNEAKKTDNYLGIDVKWLYNNQKGHRYFALYSTQREEVTLLYACKDDSAEYEHDLLKDIIELGDSPNESIDTGSTTISEILNRATNAAGQQVTNRSGTAGARSNAGNAAVHSRNQGKRYNKAFINCLENIEKVQSRYGVDDHYLFAVERGDLKTAQRMVDEAAEKAFPDSVLRGKDGKLIKMYHGSSSKHTVFRGKDFGGNNYFSPWKSYAAGYGEVRAFYLNLTNPIEYDYDFNQINNVDEDSADGFIWCGEDLANGIDQNAVGDTEVVVYDANNIKSADPVTYDDNGDVIPLSERFNAEKDDIRYSERASNKELASMDDTALYIKNTDKANYIGMIFNGAKTEETRSRRTLDAFIGKDFYVTDGKYVYGSIVLGEPHQYTEEEFHQKKNQLKHRVPVGDEYDIKPGGTKWAYPIESYKKFDKPKKLSDSTEYKNSFQARQVRYSYRGVNRSRDADQIAIAEEMERDGKSSEEIRQETGWFRSYDNRWRYEIDDSKAVWHLDTAKPDQAHLFKFGEKQYKLKDLLDHDELYRAYPQLKDVTVYVNPSTEFGGYVVGRSTDHISISNVSNDSTTKWTLIHELQHIIQNIEGFATGASKYEYSYIEWGEKEYEALTKRNEIAKKLYAILRRHGESISKEAIEYNQNSYNVSDEIIEDNYWKLQNLGWNNKKTEALVDAYYEQVQILKRTTPEGQYYATAGEIEAYDAQARMNMSAEERRAMRPNIDRSDAIVKLSERGEGTSNRHLLANALEGITNGSEEYKLIQRYKSYIAELNSLENKLSEFNQQIREIRFTKGKYDAEKLEKLEAETEKIAEAINKYDRYLISLEASEPLRKVIERERKKEAQKTKEHVKEIQQNKKLRAEQTELRHKIRKTIRDLDKILNRGNKKLNVKEDMQNVVSTALKAADILFTDNYDNFDMLRNGLGVDLSDSEEALVNECTRMLKDIDKMPTDGYDSWQARQEAENKLKAKMSKLKEVFARERKRLNNTKVSSILGELADAYSKLQDSEYSYVQGAYIEPVYTFLKNLQTEVGGTIVSDMTKDQLESLYAAYKMVLTTVRKANQMFNAELKMTREQLGNAVIEEVLKAGGVHLLGTKTGDAISQASWNNTKPVWVANRIGSDTFGKLMNGLFKGQYNFAVDVDEAKQFKLSMDEKYHPRNWDAEKLYKFESSTGKEFSLNLQQIMSLYAFSKREQAYSHLLNGGFVFEDNSTVVVDGKLGIKKTYIHKGAASYKLNEATLNGIINSLTAEQKAYVDEMQKYLSEVMGAKGNEVSMQLYGIQMFKEQFYFPLRSSGAYMEKAKEAEMKKQQGQINLVNSGFTHAVKPEARNPIILSGFMDVWAEHCNEMSMYHSMVLPMEDFRKVYNYTTVHDENMDSASVFQTIQDAYGKSATNYIDQLYRELNAGATIDPRETPYKKLISNFKKAAVMLSGSVVVQQFSSIGRAYAVIDPKHFVGAKVNSNTNLSAAEEMKKYAPVAIIKEMGGFDTGTKGSAKNYIMAEKYGKGERIKGFMKDEQYRGDIMGIAPAKADEMTWSVIWEAAKRETKAMHPKMDVKSEEFLKLAGERFSEVIEKTQVYDSVLARSANMRSKTGLMQMATAFMAEPTTTINLLEDALRGRSVKKIARAFGSVAASIVLNNALASIVYAMRDDDDDETFLEKYGQSFFSGLIDDVNPMTYYPFLKDIYSLFQGYDVERADMSVIADLRDALKKAITLIGKDTAEMDDDELAEHWKNVNGVLMGVLDAGCSALGVPVKNVRRDVNGVINAFNTIKTDVTERDTTWNSFWDKVGAAAKDTVPIYAFTKDRTKKDKLYDTIVSGDKEYLGRIKSTYKTEDSYHSAVRSTLRENDPRIKEAAQAHINGNPSERVRIAKQIIADGFEQDDVVMAINAEINAMTPDDDTGTKKAKGFYTVEDFVREIANGDQATANAVREDVIQTAQKNGKTAEAAEKSFASSVKSEAKKSYLDGNLNDSQAEKILLAVGETEEDVAPLVIYWDFCRKHPQYDFSQSNVEKYLEFAEPAGISVDVFVQYINGTKGLATIYDEWGDVELSKRDQVLEVIDSLDLTWEQKDALYLAAGYSEDEIWDVPW